MRYPQRRPITPWCGIDAADLTPAGWPDIQTPIKDGRLLGLRVVDRGTVLGYLGLRVTTQGIESALVTDGMFACEAGDD